MDLGISGKNAIVCASSGGIGRGIAESLAREGVNISILGRDEEKLEAARNEISKIATGKVIATKCDLSNKDEIKSMFDKTLSELGSVDILINNHGGPKAGAFSDISHEDTVEAMDLCLFSVLYLTELCLEQMNKNSWGRIINILSLSAKEPIKGMYLSNLIRPAILGFAKTISLENAANGITVNSLLPAAVLSDRTSYFVNKGAEDKGISFEEELTNVSSGLPTKHIATPEEFAQTATFLCSKNASYVNGATISVDGGVAKGLY